MRWSPTLVLAFVELSLATPLVNKRWEEAELLEKHSWVEIPNGWVYTSAPDPDHLLDMRIGLKKHRVEELISTLYEVSSPDHARYGQHLSKEQVDELVAPHPDSVEAVESWLEFHGADLESLSRTDSGNWVTITLSVAQAERMLGTTYGVYYHPETSSSVVRTLSYSLPNELHNHISVIAPTTYFSTLRSMRATSFIQAADLTEEDEADLKASGTLSAAAVVPTSCNTAITVSCLRALYNTTDYVPQSTDTNILGAAGYLDQYANRADLQNFLSRYRADQVGVTYTTTQIQGGGDDQNDPGVEANLDIQYTVGMSAPTKNIYYSTGGSPPFIPDSQTPTNTNEPYLDWLNYILAQSIIPQTFTTSYGDDEQTVPNDYAVSVCELFAELGARGSTILFSSGDFGVGGGDCRTNDGTNTRLFQPAFPASCPFVTAVGGTVRTNPEVGVSFSGGGFSRYFAMPSYQSAAVSSFVSTLGTTYTGLYNASGRAYPDLAAQGSAFRVVISGSVYSVGGTSASSPTVAGIISLLNDYRLSLGKSSLGFINPLIYANPGGFNDIISGSNPGCSTSGFTARAGWDPVTGLGTPDFLKLQPIVAA